MILCHRRLIRHILTQCLFKYNSHTFVSFLILNEYYFYVHSAGLVKQRYCKEEARPTGERCRRLPGYADVSRTGALHTRSFTPHPFHHFSPASETEAYCILIANVNYREGSMTLYGRTITCPCGDSIKSLDTWARLSRWSKTRVRRFFLNLQKLQLIKYSIDHSLAHIHVVDFLP